MKLFAIFFILICFTPHVIYAQSNRSAKKDSLALKQTTSLLYKIDSTHKADSLRKMELLDQIENLKGSELQRETLVKKLRAQESDDSLHKVEQLTQLRALKVNSIGYPVTPFLDTLFLIYTRVGSFSPSDRAAFISSRIEKLYDNYEFNPDSLKVNAGETSAEIVFNDMVVMSINEMEALWHDKKTADLANKYLVVIRKSIQDERKANSFTNILLRIFAVLLIVAGIYLVIVFFNRLFKRINTRIIRLKDTSLRGIRLKNYQLLDSKRQLQVILFLLNLLRLLLIVITLYVALPLIFSVFPWTRGIAETLIGWILSPLKRVISSVINYLPNLFAIMVIIVVTRYVIKFMEFIASEIESGTLTISGFYPDWAKPTLNIIKFLVYAFSFIIIFPYLPGSDSPIFQGVSVFVGILFSLGSSSAIANAVAGLVITYMRPFKVGDRIKIGDVSGDVIQKTLLVTRVRTIKNEDITVPNASILSGYTVNYSTSAKELGLILYTSVTIGYDVPWKQVHELLLNAALITGDVMKDESHKPFVLQTSLDDFYVSYQLNAYTEQSGKMASVYSELHQNIQDKFNEAGVEIMSPHYQAARDGNATTIPSGYLPKDYKAPSFHVSVKKDDQNR